MFSQSSNNSGGGSSVVVVVVATAAGGKGEGVLGVERGGGGGAVVVVVVIVVVVVVVEVVVEEVIIVRFDAQYRYLKCYNNIYTRYRYVGCLRHPRCTDRNITRFCLFGKWGVKATPFAQNWRVSEMTNGQYRQLNGEK